MARTSKTTQTSTDYVVVPTMAAFAAAADGHVIDAGNVRLVVNNASGSSVNVTAQATAAVGALDVEDLVVPVAAGAPAGIGPFPKTIFGQPAGANESGSDDQGRVYVNVSLATSVTAAVVAVSMPRR